MTKRNTKKRIIEAFMELAKTKGIDKISVVEISEKCGITSQTFYNHFSDKYELVLWTYRYRVDSIFEMYKNESITWEETLKRYIYGFNKHANFIINALTNFGGPRSYENIVSKYLSDAMIEMIEFKKGEKMSDYYVFQARLYCHGVIDMIAEWLENGMVMTEDELISLIIDSSPHSLEQYIQLKDNG